jgi:predicted HNH restriction endonuclease
MYAVMVENDESEWDDVTGEMYHFPRKYLSILKPDTKVIYYKGKLNNTTYRDIRMSDEPHYFGTATIGEVAADPLSLKGDHFCGILDYASFTEPILARIGGAYLEEIPLTKLKNYWRDGVRAISREVYEKITGSASLVETTVVLTIPKLSDDFESTLKEGGKKYRFTAYYERKPKYRKAAIEIHGYTCMACDFNFEHEFGQHGKSYIHVHHNKPVSGFSEATAIDPSTDMSVLCPNCHAMVHRDKSHTLTLAELMELRQQHAG